MDTKICQRCKFTIDKTKEEYWIIAGNSFHTQCFKCTGCRKSIVKSEFFTIGGIDKTLCVTCFEKFSKSKAKKAIPKSAEGVCNVCKSSIYGQFIKVCGNYRVLITNSSVNDSIFLCIFVIEKFAWPETNITALHYHPQCFTCSICYENLSKTVHTFDYQGFPFCQACYNQKYASKCASCRQPIGSQSKRIIANLFSWKKIIGVKNSYNS